MPPVSLFEKREACYNPNQKIPTSKTHLFVFFLLALGESAASRSAASKDIDNFQSSLTNDNGVSVEIPELVKKYLDLVESKVFGEGRAKWSLVPDEFSAFLESLDWDSKLTKSVQESKPKEEKSESSGSLINPIEGIQQRAVLYLEEESKTAESESESTKSEAFPGYSDDFVSSLSKIPKQMISGGYKSECC
ncbi:hypothetical protein SO802_007676 [Lithocarpus litseifolius]|uniref:Uncharacterized protein n=1 Tax=Lithocarpus litseifolius TaxID=425828 RepID=A0AAW2DSK5_9ROSI